MDKYAKYSILFFIFLFVIVFRKKSNFTNFKQVDDKKIKYTSNENDILGYYSFPYLNYRNPNYWNESIGNYYDIELSKNWHRYNDQFIQ